MKKKKYLTAYHHELEKNAEDIALLLPKGLITLEGGEDILHIFHKKNFSERLAGIRKHILSETGFIPPLHQILLRHIVPARQLSYKNQKCLCCRRRRIP